MTFCLILLLERGPKAVTFNHVHLIYFKGYFRCSENSGCKEMRKFLSKRQECQGEPLANDQADIQGELKNRSVLQHGRHWERLTLLLNKFVLFSSEMVGY